MDRRRTHSALRRQSTNEPIQKRQPRRSHTVGPSVSPNCRRAPLGPRTVGPRTVGTHPQRRYFSMEMNWMSEFGRVAAIRATIARSAALSRRKGTVQVRPLVFNNRTLSG